MNRRWLRAVVGLRTRFDLNSIFQCSITSHQRIAIVLRVPSPAKLDRNFVRINLLPHFNCSRQSIDGRRAAENRSFEALIDDATVLKIVIRAPSAERDRQHNENGQGDADGRIAKHKSLAGCAKFLSLRNFKLDGHFN